MVALGRIREGGCILADEVGLGKTIEAGLIIAQLFAEALVDGGHQPGQRQHQPALHIGQRHQAGHLHHRQRPCQYHI